MTLFSNPYGRRGFLAGGNGGAVSATCCIHSVMASVMFCPRMARTTLKRWTVDSSTYACTSFMPGRIGRFRSPIIKQFSGAIRVCQTFLLTTTMICA